ncbi:MAG TPA: hypothetical protein VF600_00395 [Abditibacteriaceae bacterium]|jgi:hypothetical protein
MKPSPPNEWRVVTVRVLIGVALGFAIPLLAYLVFGKVPHGLPKEQRAKIEIPAAPNSR